MSRKHLQPLTQADLSEFINQAADFALEMSTLAVLRSLDFQAEHAAVYTDPVTSRLRAYDIRARYREGARTIRLAIECKNLRLSAPLLIHATPRAPSEAYNTVVIRYRQGGYLSQDAHKLNNVYPAGQPVGRQTDQPVKEGGEFRSSDAPTYEKWLQAVNGCYDLVKELALAPISKPEACAVLPILVVPGETLWQVDYSESGEIRVPVGQVERATLILRHPWTVPAAHSPLTYDISHLEIVTLPALRQRLKNLISAGGLLTGTDDILERVR